MDAKKEQMPHAWPPTEDGTAPGTGIAGWCILAALAILAIALMYAGASK